MLSLFCATTMAVLAPFPETIFSRANSRGDARTLVFSPGTENVVSTDAPDLGAWVATLAKTTHLEVRGYFCAEDQASVRSDQELIHLAEARAIKFRHRLITAGFSAANVSTVAYGSASGTKACRAMAFPKK